MHLGKTILQLRRKQNITQDELAAELGVTAAAVSKWENGYTLPDILMLCALADYFQVTTDELLGRNPKAKYAVVAVTSQELGQQIIGLAKGYGFITKQVCSSYQDALDAAKADPAITHLFASFDRPLREEEKGDTPDGLCTVESQSETVQQVLDGFEIYFRNMPSYDVTMQKRSEKR